MKFSIKKSKAIALFIAMAVAVSGIFTVSGTAKAADESSVTNILEVTDGKAVANTTVNHAFSITSSTNAAIEVMVPALVGMTIQVTRTSDSKLLYNEAVSANNDPNTGWDYETNGNFYYYVISWQSPTVADYNLSLTFDADTDYMAVGVLSKPSASISNSSIILTKGFSQKLSVTNATVSKWSSSNTKVAAVDKNGKVTAKSTGTATISAATSTGETVKCAVTVKANTYSDPAFNLSDASYGHVYITISKVSYNKKGDLVIKATFLNNKGQRIVELTNIKLDVKNKAGKTIGTYSLKSKKVSILHGGKKTLTFTVKKAKLKQKATQDLRQADVKSSFRYRYRV
ncbi:MAG: hypothetical protein HFH73_04005 [Lachnospiraceae bacterium]|jgi:uncharacterized protein YjdB|nr:hypothetical protein [Lachnospiraceae bacterium]